MLDPDLGQYKEWTLPNGVKLRMTQDKLRKHRLRVMVDGEVYSIPKEIFDLFLKVAGADIEKPDSSNVVVVNYGHVGPTDACLNISDGVRFKEFLIDSDSWKVVSGVIDNSKNLPQTFHPGEDGQSQLVALLNKDTSKDERRRIFDHRQEV